MVKLLKQSGLSGNIFDMVVRREEEFLLRDTLKRMSKLSFKPSDRIVVSYLPMNTPVHYSIL